MERIDSAGEAGVAGPVMAGCQGRYVSGYGRGHSSHW